MDTDLKIINLFDNLCYVTDKFMKMLLTSHKMLLTNRNFHPNATDSAERGLAALI